MQRSSHRGIFLRQIKECGRIPEIPLSGEFVLEFPEAAIQAMEVGLELAQKCKISLIRNA